MLLLRLTPTEPKNIIPRNVGFKTLFMTFGKRLREGVRRGEITCSVRIWTRPRVRVGARYRIEEGEIEIDSIDPIGFPDITPELASARVWVPRYPGPAQGRETRAR